MAAQTTSPAQIAARVIAAIGRADFPERLLSVYRDVAGCDLCSAFVWESQRAPKLLFAAGVHPQISGFALSASRAYAKQYWQRDTAVRRSAILSSSGLSLLRTTATDIRDPDYRRDCYQRGGISERLTLFDTAFPIVSVSGYRTVSRGPTTSQVAQRMADAGPTLVAALRRHNELIERAAQNELAPSRGDLIDWARECGLSAREAEVAASIAMGHSQSDIAKSTGLGLNSVITYRRRAYQKLQVADRRELRAMCGRMISPADPLRHFPAET
jgi:DNA-binding CsgD family transcriptional regulator